MSESSAAHIYATEQLFRCAERAPLYLRELGDAEIRAVQLWLLMQAEQEAAAAKDALHRENESKEVGDAHASK